MRISQIANSDTLCKMDRKSVRPKTSRRDQSIPASLSDLSFNEECSNLDEIYPSVTESIGLNPYLDVSFSRKLNSILNQSTSNFSNLILLQPSKT